MSNQFIGSRASWAQAPGAEASSAAAIAQQQEASPIKFSSPAGGRQRPVRRYSARKPAVQRRTVLEQQAEAAEAAPPPPPQPSFVFKAAGTDNVPNVRATRTPRKPARKPAATKAAPSPGLSVPISRFADASKQQQHAQSADTKAEETMSEDIRKKLSLNDQAPGQSVPSTSARAAGHHTQQPQQQPFVFTAGSKVEPRQPEPAAPKPEPPQQTFVFQAKQPQQQPQFVSIKEIGKTPRAPLRTKHRRRAVAPSTETVGPTTLNYDVNSTQPLPQRQQESQAIPAHRPAQPAGPPKDSKTEALESAAQTATNLRSAGNEAFRQQQYEQAYNLYTKAAEAIWPFPELHKQLALILCNRAAASLSLGRPLKALHDCRMGLQYDSSYAKCVLRMSTCHVRMGNFVKAHAQLQKLSKVAEGDLGLAKEVKEKAQEISDIEGQLLATLRTLGHTVPAATGAAASQPQSQSQQQDLKGGLASLDALFCHIPHSEVFHAAKADALLRLGRFAEAKAVADASLHGEGADGSPIALWRMWVDAQIAFHKGDIDATEQRMKELGARLEASRQADAFNSPGAEQGTGEDLLHAVVRLPSVQEISEFLSTLNVSRQARMRGNAAVKSKDYQAAVEAYTEALGVAEQSASMAGVLHSNRAAAYQALGEITLALADCCRAKALAPGFAKAHSRMATLLSEVQLFSAAADELKAALALPELDAATRKEYSKRYKEALEASNKERPANHYKLLGVERQSSLDQIRKAYKKLALQLHPDKAVRSSKFSCHLTSTGATLADSEEPLNRLKENVTWLFKSLGEAHDVLSDASKRQEYDEELQASEYAARFNSRGMYGDYMSNSSHRTYGSTGGSYSSGYGRSYSTGYGGFGGGFSNARYGSSSYNHYGRANANAYGNASRSSNRSNNRDEWAYWAYH